MRYELYLRRTLGCKSGKLRSPGFAAPLMNWIQQFPDDVLPVVNKEAPVLGRALAAHAMTDAQVAKNLLKPFRRCIHCAQQTKEHLTPFHAAYLHMCGLWLVC
jgi:hypothetical protein